MASFLQFLLLFSLSLHLAFVSADDQSSETQTQPRPPTPITRPTKLVLKVQKDGGTNLHVAQIFKRTPPVQLPFVVDLNGEFVSVNCENKYLSSTFNAPICHSAQCSRANTHTCRTCSPKSPRYPVARPGCHVNACAVTAVNPVTQQRAIGELSEDVLSIPSTLGSRPGPMVTIPQFLFACAPSILLQRGLPQNVQGIAGMGHSRISLPSQLASQFGIPPKIAICLASGSGQNGVIFFGEGPYMMLPGIDVSRQLTYAPLSIGQQGEYLINVQSIQINNNIVPLPPKFRSNQAMLSTTTPYTILHQSIFIALTQLYIKQFSGVPQVTAVPPFGLCFDANKISYSKMGPAVPSIQLVLDNQQKLRWTISGQNVIVQARPGVMCLAMVNGGLNPKTPIVIGGRQMEDNLVQLDLVNSRVGFSNSLLFQRTNCANFNLNFNANTTATP
ncbi:putative aspartic peptidase A1 family, xylanase inhibitor [Rosa chinensis]|uniref:Putative aspartic peptidase A1 family, xylanase inhibitor n=1 Tax=Rosa chinensis TaxID=74649 RepID=A0A2P6R6V2_ROSCH|nr:gamma conglutin 1 [Rosa chinensis]PRQ42129.1 putative aspartic peptidase A1 family, xylanase inhibitor [Rosa chinensis]